MRRILCFLLLLSLLQSAISSPLHPEVLCAADASGTGMRHVHWDGNAAGGRRHCHGHRHGHTPGDRHRHEGAEVDSSTCNCLKSSHQHDASAAWLPDLTIDFRRCGDDFAMAESVLSEHARGSLPAACASVFPTDECGSSWSGGQLLCLRL